MHIAAVSVALSFQYAVNYKYAGPILHSCYMLRR